MRSEKHWIGVCAPVVTAGLLRFSQLLILVVILAVEPSSKANALVATFGVMSAAAVVTDSGAATYLLANGRADQSLKPILLVHVPLATMGSFGALMYSASQFGILSHLDLAVVGMALVVSQTIDSTTRVLRSPLLVSGQDLRYANSEGIMALGKGAVCLVAFVLHDSILLAFLPLGSLGAMGLTLRALSRDPVNHDAQPWKQTARRVIPFGLNGMASSLYSQAPLLIAAGFLATDELAILVVVYRIIQPLEMLPSTVSSQVIPRIRAGRLAVPPVLLGFCAAGFLTAFALIAGTNVWIHVFSITSPEFATLLLLGCLSIPAKFTNYALAAAHFARGRVHTKLLITTVVGALAVVASVLLIPMGGGPRVSLIIATTELTLAGLLGISLYIARRRQNESPSGISR